MAIYGATGIAAGALIVGTTYCLIEAAGGSAALGATETEIWVSKAIITSSVGVDVSPLISMVNGTVDYACGHGDNDPIKDYIFDGERLCETTIGNLCSGLYPIGDSALSSIKDTSVPIIIDSIKKTISDKLNESSKEN